MEGPRGGSSASHVYWSPDVRGAVLSRQHSYYPVLRSECSPRDPHLAGDGRMCRGGAPRGRGRAGRQGEAPALNPVLCCDRAWDLSSDTGCPSPSLNKPRPGRGPEHPPCPPPSAGCLPLHILPRPSRWASRGPRSHYAHNLASVLRLACLPGCSFLTCSSPSQN